jgi:sialate O-acetylesterase
VRVNPTWHSLNARHKGPLTTLAAQQTERFVQLNIATNASVTPRQTFASTVRWIVGSPETVGNFSATCYYFARELKKNSNAPIGMIVAAWGGARVRNWVSESGLRQLGLDNDDLDMLAISRTDQQSALRRWAAKWESWWKKERPSDGEPVDCRLQRRVVGSRACRVRRLGELERHEPGWICRPDVDADHGVPHCRIKRQNRAPVLDLGSVNEEDETWINGKDVGASSFAEPHTTPDPAWRAEGRHQRHRHKHFSVVGATAVFAEPAETRVIRFADGTSVPLSGAWKYREVSDTLIAPQLPWGPTHGVTIDYNGMISPIGAYGLRGVVWYQGESDIYFARNYKATLLAMMTDWRRQFENRDLPFLVVQLPNYGPVPSQPTESVWADVREAQRQAAMEDKHAALSVNIDIGDSTNLHPTNKREVGRRLAIAARHLLYGERIPPSGPVVSSVKRRGQNIVVEFRDVNRGRCRFAALLRSGFELCGTNSVFV